MIDADNAVSQRLAIGELHRELGAGIHRGLRLGVGGRRLALGGDVLGNCLLLTEGPFLRVSFASLASAAWTVAEPAPLPLPEPLGSQVPPAVPFTNTPATVLNWFLIADETQGPAIITTRTIIAMTRTYSMAPWPRRRVFLGDTHPPKVNCRCMHMRHSLRMGIDIACRAYVKSNRLARNVPLRQRRHGCPRHINCLPFCFFRPTATPSGG